MTEARHPRPGLSHEVDRSIRAYKNAPEGARVNIFLTKHPIEGASMFYGDELEVWLWDRYEWACEAERKRLSSGGFPSWIFAKERLYILAANRIEPQSCQIQISYKMEDERVKAVIHVTVGGKNVQHYEGGPEIECFYDGYWVSAEAYQTVSED